ncbi:MAG: FGGY family carbohydrate kinase [Gemmataceae bacterium]
MTAFLGIDLGTTFLKGAVLDLDRPALRQVRRLPFPAPLPGLPPTRCELDPAAVLAATRQLIGELLDDAPDATGLLLSSQMHCLVFLDANRRPVSNVLTWKDQRALEDHLRQPGRFIDVLREQITAAELQATGRELRVGVPLVTLPWLQTHGQLPADTWPTSLPDFVLASLCGTVPTTDPSNAAAYGLYDLDRSDWHRPLIDRLELGGLRWPAVRRFGEVVGTAEVHGRRLTCYTAIGDQQCSLVGAGLEEGELSLNVSTGSQVSLLTRERRTGDFGGRPYPDELWLSTIVQVPAGRALAALVGLLTEIGGERGDPWDRIARAVADVPSTDLQVNLAFYGGPFGDRGAIANMGEHNLTVGHLFTAAFRNMADNYALCAHTLAPAHDWKRLVFSGGLVHRFPTLRDAVLRALAPVPGWRVCPSTEDTLLGLLTLAVAYSGRAPSVRAAGRLVAGEHSSPPSG